MNFNIANIIAHGDGYVIYEKTDNSDVSEIEIVVDSESDTSLIANLRKVEGEINCMKELMCNVQLDSAYKKRIASAIISSMMGCIEESKLHFLSIEEDVLAYYSEELNFDL